MADEAAESIKWEDEEFIEEDSSEADAAQFQSRLQEIKRRAEEAKIRCEIQEYEDSTSLKLWLSSGRDERAVFITSLSEADALLAFEFEKTRFVPKYEAFWFRDEGVAEFLLGVRRALRAERWLSDLPDGRIVLSSENPSFPDLSFGALSDKASLFVRRPGRFGLRIKSKEASDFLSSDQIVAALDRFGSSLLYQIDNAWGTAISLIRERPRPLRILRGKPAMVDLEYPKYEYNAAPLALYRYAQNSPGMPLLQFLAYYQVVEYFFPFYSKAEAQRRMRLVLKDPAFRAERDTDIARLISCIRETRAGALFDERTQLRATIMEAVNSDHLSTFLKDEWYREFFKKDYKEVYNKKIEVDSNDDKRHDIAERIYGIRCKIVHTKADSSEVDMDLMLPYSDEEQHLGVDVQIMEFVARSCINASGMPLQ